MQDDIFAEATGLSMWPCCQPQDKLLLKKIPVVELKSGDIVAYKVGANIVCHRLVRKLKEKNGYFLYIRGDHPFSLGELVSQERLVGKAIAIVRKNRLIRLTGLRMRFVHLGLLAISPLFSLAIRLKRCVLPVKKIA